MNRRYKCKECGHTVAHMPTKPSWACHCGAMRWVAVRKREHRYLYKQANGGKR